MEWHCFAMRFVSLKEEASDFMFLLVQLDLGIHRKLSAAAPTQRLPERPPTVQNKMKMWLLMASGDPLHTWDAKLSFRVRAVWVDSECS